MKKLHLFVTIGIVMALMLAGCSNSGGNKAATESNSLSTSATASASASEPAKNVTLKIFNIKVEIAEALGKLKQEYESTHPGVTLEIDTQISDQYVTTLKSKFTGGEMPDLFNVGGYREMGVWAEHLEDLSGEPWMADVVDSAKPAATVDGKIYGFPTALEGVGYIYNKDLFAKAGITKVPVTLTELKDAVNKLNAAQITPFIVPYGSWYSPGVFSSDNPMAKQSDPDQFMADLSGGTKKFADNPLFKDFLASVKLELANAYKDPLTVDYNGQVTSFATSQGAITVGCNCTQPLFDQVTPNMNLGMMPMPINDDAVLNDKLFVSVPYYWVISKSSAVKPEAKEFLNWLATDGAKYITDEFKFVPPFKSMKVDPSKLGSLGVDVKQYVDENKVLSGTVAKWPEGVIVDFGSSLQKMASNKIDETQVLAEFQAAWDKLSKK
ncbi:ABC transporter substrate-binding protein [Cohnella sp.]|uniref:ABC transporter substrate-binding protein n=1 Tax=Cohnella sp. TaxID=1883426 RepID=UPI003566A452